MDLGDTGSEHGNEPKPRALPSDLPKSLDDRRHVPIDLVPETEMYDGWQGMYALCSRAEPPDTNPELDD